MSSTARNSAALAAGLLAVQLLAQSPDLSCLRRPYAWPGLPALDPRIPVRPVVEGGEVLSDSLRIAFLRAQARFMTMIVERTQVVRFDDRGAIDRLATITLPESFDPAYDQQDLPLEARDRVPRPIYISPTVDRFAARLLGNSERAGDLIAEGRVIKQRIKQGDRFWGTWNYAIKLQGVLPGDTVQVTYQYRVPCSQNTQRFLLMRYFFEGPLPKRNACVALEADASGGVTHWGLAPDSTATQGGMRKSFWSRSDLPGLAFEPGARPGTDRPHFVIGMAASSGWFTHRMMSGQVVELDYWATVLRQRESKAFWWRRVADKKFPDAQTTRMKEFLARYSDPDPVVQATRVHDAIARDFRYHDDYYWWANVDTGLPKMGDQMRDGELREISRYDLYSKYLSLLHLKYYTAYVFDKRVGRLSLDYLSPLWDSEWLFLLNDSGHAVTFHPKKRRFGLLANELPFYWEGMQALVGDVDKLWADEEMAPELGLRPELIPIGQLRPEFNNRTTDATIEVQLAEGAATIDANVVLSGQWSTQCRGAWLYHEVDSTVDPGYGRLLSEARGMKEVKVTLGELPTGAPFRFKVHVQAAMTGRVIPVGDSLFAIDLGGLIDHVVPRDFVAEGRELPFWFDFMGLDACTFLLRFDHPVKLRSELSTWPATIRQSFASLAVMVRQLDEHTLEVSDHFTVKKEKVEPADAAALEQVLTAAGAGSFNVVVERASGTP